MNANTIISEDMTLDQKLKAIDKAMAEFEAKHKVSNPDTPFDPQDLLQCEGCQ